MTTEEQVERWLAARVTQASHTPGPWGPMTDGALYRKPWEPWKAMMEAAPGLTIGSAHNTEPVCRVSGYLQPCVANAKLIAAAPLLYEACAALLALVEFMQKQHPEVYDRSAMIPTDDPIAKAQAAITAVLS